MNRYIECYKELTDSGVEIPYGVEQLRVMSHCEVEPMSLSIFESGNGEPLVESPMGLYFVDPEEGAVASLTMKMAQAAHIVTAQNTLVKTTDGELRLAVRRVDINSGGDRLPMEDGCQVSELSFDERYEGAYEEVMEMIEEYSSVGRIDVITLWEQVVFAWICGYSDFNLKNIALYEPYSGICSLAPLRFATSDLLLGRGSVGDMALSINNKRKGVVRQDLECAMRRSGLKGRAINIIFKKFVASRDRWIELIEESLLDEEQRRRYVELLDNSLSQLTPKE